MQINDGIFITILGGIQTATFGFIAYIIKLIRSKANSEDLVGFQKRVDKSLNEKVDREYHFSREELFESRIENLAREMREQQLIDQKAHAELTASIDKLNVKLASDIDHVRDDLAKNKDVLNGIYTNVKLLFDRENRKKGGVENE